MAGGNALAVLLAAAAGLGSSAQAAIFGRFGNRIVSIEALCCSMLAAGVTGTIVIVVARESLHRFGLFGVDQIALHWPRLLGIALLAAGAALSLHT